MTEPVQRNWLNRAALPFGLVLLAALGGGVVWLRLHLAIDRCVDAGGKWGYDDRRCTFVEPEIAVQPAAVTPAAVTPAASPVTAPASGTAPTAAPTPEPAPERVEQGPSVTAGWR